MPLKEERRKEKKRQEKKKREKKKGEEKEEVGCRRGRSRVYSKIILFSWRCQKPT